MSAGADNKHTTHDIQPIPYLFEGDNLIRCILILGLPWFVVVDICRVLGIKQPTRAVEKLDDDEKGVCDIHTLGGIQTHLVVSESGLYTLMLRSHAAMEVGTPAHRFRKWVTSDLIPTIRKTGRYNSASQPLPGSPKESDSEKLQKVAEVRRLCGQRAALDLWVALGLETVPSMFHPSRQGEFGFTIDLDDSPPSAPTVVN
jgi:prophage antirepressor-like protein